MFAFGYLALTDLEHWRAPRIMIGLLFGIGMVVSMIRQPERFTRNLSFFAFVPLLAFLVVITALTGTGTEILTTVVCSLTFLGVQIAFAYLPSEASVKSQPRQIQEAQAVPPNRPVTPNLKS